MAKGTRGYRFINLYFDRFLEHLMKEKPAANYYRLLDDADREALARPFVFIAEASLEEKLLLLSRIGYPFALVVGTPQKEPTRDYMQKILSTFFKLLSWKRREAVKVLRERFFFMLGDLDFVKSLKLAANIYNSPAGASISGYGAIAQKLYNYTAAEQKNMMRDQAAGHDIDTIVLEAMRVVSIPGVQNTFMGNYGVGGYQYMILGVLSKHRQLSLGGINKLTGVRNIPKHLETLFAQKMIDKKLVETMEGKNEYHYWLTGLGEQTLIKARTHFIKNLL